MTTNLASKIIQHVADSGCDDVFSKPFFADRWEEALLSDPNWAELFSSQIGAALTQNPVAVGNLCHLAVPKGRYTFRSVAQMSLIDTLKFTALTFAIGKTIERQRLPKTTVFSNRFLPRLCRLDRSNYDLFRATSKQYSESGKFRIKVITDIANYYDRINLHKLENILKEISCDEKIVSKINRILIQWSNQQSYGVPVGSDASRLLAEAMLINADRELSHHRIKFIRYVDDYRIFCKSPEAAYEAMQILDAALRREGLFLNSGKTRLIDLFLETHEETQHNQEFEPIDLEEKEEKTKFVRSRYSVRIAKYYRYPGKEAVDKLRKLDLNKMLSDISDPNTSEEDLKRFLKAAFYQSTPSFKWINAAIDLYPHLIPYVADAIVKEFDRDQSSFGRAFIREASAKMRNIFQNYNRNDYFRIQAARALCKIDPQASHFISKQLLKHSSTNELVFSQCLYFMGSTTPRAQFLDMVDRFAAFGFYARVAIAHLLHSQLVLKGDERRSWMKNLAGTELEPFLLKLLRDYR